MGRNKLYPGGGHGKLDEDGDWYRCGHIEEDGTRCEFCSKDEFEITSHHATPAHNIKKPGQGWKNLITTISEAEGKRLQAKFTAENRGKGRSRVRAEKGSKKYNAGQALLEMQEDDRKRHIAAEALLELKYGGVRKHGDAK